MNEKFKYLFKNIGFLTIGQFGTKLLSFFLVPLYTNILTTSEYGIYDLFTTTVNLLIPILTLNISEGIAIFALDKETDKAEIMNVALRYAIRGGLIVTVFVVVIKKMNLLETMNDYWFFLPILFFFTILSTIFSEFARGLEKVKELSIGGLIGSGTMIVLNVIFLVILKLGMLGYFLATIIGLLIQIICLFFLCEIWKYIKKAINRDLKNEMKEYTVPLIANSIGWWINNSSDKYVVTVICGIVENGIYSVAYKIPSILNIIQSIFAQAWSISAIKEFDSKDSKGFFSLMYSYYNYILTIMCSLIIIFDKFMASFLYAKDFYVAWRYVPFLTISIIFGALSGFLGGFFGAVKNSKIFAKSTIISAIVNTLLNLTLVRFIGALGAAVATMVCYYLVWIIRYIDVRKYIAIKINIIRDHIGYGLLVIQSLILIIVKNNLLCFFIQAVCFLSLLILYKKENKLMIQKVFLTRTNGGLIR